MFKDYEPIEQRLIKAMLMNPVKPEFFLQGTEQGFEVFLRNGKKIFKLYTQRKAPRIFRSPNTAINFLAELGAESIMIEGLNNWKPDTYVNQNSRSKKKNAKNTNSLKG